MSLSRLCSDMYLPLGRYYTQVDGSSFNIRVVLAGRIDYVCPNYVE